MAAILPYGLSAILLVAGALAYANSLHGGFLYDDRSSIPHNPHIRQLWPLSASLTTPPQTAIAGRPVVSFTLALNHAFGELNVTGYHAFNICVHLLCALLLFGIIRRTFLTAKLNTYSQRSGTWIAFAVAAIWMNHPLQTESVAYIIQRTELLMGLFFLLTLYCALRGWSSAYRWTWFAASVVCCALGMGCKEVMVSAPLIVLLYQRAFVTGSFGESLRRSAGLYAGLAATWLILAALMATGPRNESAGFGLGISALDYLRTQAEVLVWYLRLCLWPDPLAASYEWTLAQTFADCMPEGLLVAVLLIATGWALRGRSVLGFLGAWFFLILAPTSSIVPIVTEVAGERRLYLPLAAVVVLVVLGVHRILRALFNLTPAPASARPAVSAALLIAVVALAGYGTFQRNKVYEGDLALWSDTVAKRPANYRAHSNLAAVLLQDGRIDEAIAHCREAIRLRPDHARAHANFGLALKRDARIDEAIREYETALHFKPDEPQIHHNLAIALLAAGKIGDAIEHFTAALKIDSARPLTHLNLAEALVLRGEHAQAVEYYTEALRSDPDLAAAHFGLANTLAILGDSDQAIACYRRALRLHPDQPNALVNLGRLLAHQGDLDEALEHYRAALRIDPDHARATESLNAALAAKARPPAP